MVSAPFCFATSVYYNRLSRDILCLYYFLFFKTLFQVNSFIIHSLKKLPLSFRFNFSFSMTERRRFHTAVQIFKSLHQSSPSYLHNIFHYSKDITGHVGRNINRLFVPRIRNNFGRRSFYYRGTVLWNSLSQVVVEAASLSSFKKLYFDF